MEEEEEEGYDQEGNEKLECTLKKAVNSNSAIYYSNFNYPPTFR